MLARRVPHAIVTAAHMEVAAERDQVQAVEVEEVVAGRQFDYPARCPTSSLPVEVVVLATHLEPLVEMGVEIKGVPERRQVAKAMVASRPPVAAAVSAPSVSVGPALNIKVAMPVIRKDMVLAAVVEATGEAALAEVHSTTTDLVEEALDTSGFSPRVVSRS